MRKMKPIVPPRTRHEHRDGRRANAEARYAERLAQAKGLRWLVLRLWMKVEIWLRTSAGDFPGEPPVIHSHKHSV